MSRTPRVVPPLLRSTPHDPAEATELWFVRNGLPYFVPGERAAARAALSPRRVAPLVALVGLLAIGSATGLSLWLENLSLLPATITQVLVVVAVFYAVSQLRFRPILTWAFGRTVSSLRMLLPMLTRALPLLLIFVTFLFINAEVWQLSANLDGGRLWLVVLLFALMGVGFFLVRMPEELDRVDRELDSDAVMTACAGTPMEGEARRLHGQGVDLAGVTSLRRYERANLMLVLVITQAVQVLLLAASVFAFFLVFGLIAMTEPVVTTWTAEEGVNPFLSVELLQVAVFLSAFSGLYFTVYVVTDEVYRDQFFAGVLGELERAVAVRAAYLELREERGMPDIAEEGHEDDDAPDASDGAGESTGDDPAGQPGTRSTTLPPQS